MNTSKPESTRETDDRVKRTADGVEDASQGVKSVLPRVAVTVSSVAKGAYTKAADVTGVAMERLGADGRRVWEVTASAAGQLMATTLPLLASSLYKELNLLIDGMLKGGVTIYDKAKVKTMAGRHPLCSHTPAPGS